MAGDRAELARIAQARREAFVQSHDDILDGEATLSEVVIRRRNEVAPSVRQLLAEFNVDTAEKLRLAPINSRPKVHLSDGTLCEVDPEGWVRAFDEADTPPTINVDPISVVDTQSDAKPAPTIPLPDQQLSPETLPLCGK